MNELLVNMLLEYMLNSYTRYENDLIYLRDHIKVHGLDSDSLNNLIVAETRFDTISAEYRKIRFIIDTYK